MFMCFLQNAGQEWNKTIVNKAFVQVSDLKGKGTWAHKNIKD